MEVKYRSVIVLACVLLFGCDPKTPDQDSVKQTPEQARREAPLSPRADVCPPLTLRAEHRAASGPAQPDSQGSYLPKTPPLVPALFSPPDRQQIYSSPGLTDPNGPAYVTFSWLPGTAQAPSAGAPRYIAGPTTHYKLCVHKLYGNCNDTDAVVYDYAGDCNATSFYTSGGLPHATLQGKRLEWKVAACNGQRCSHWSDARELIWRLPETRLLTPPAYDPNQPLSWPVQFNAQWVNGASNYIFCIAVDPDKLDECVYGTGPWVSMYLEGGNDPGLRRDFVPATIETLLGTDRMAYWTMTVCSLDLPELPNDLRCTRANEKRPIKFPPNP